MEIITTPTDRDVTAQSEVGVGDGGGLNDFGGFIELEPNRTVFLIVDQQPYETGFRGTLIPPHRPAYEHLDELDKIEPTVLVAVWDGPGSIRDDQLKSLSARRWPIVPFYRPSANGLPLNRDEVLANLQVLLEWLINSPSPYRVDGKILVALDLSDALQPYSDDLLSFVETAAEFNLLVKVSNPDAAPFQALGYWTTCHDAIDVLDDRQIPCVGPKQGRGSLDPESDFANRLVEARLLSDAGHRQLLVDGLGRWDNDGQLDSVVGSDTVRPEGLTGGQLIKAYGEGRVQQVRRMLARSQDGNFISFFDQDVDLVGRGDLRVDTRAGALQFKLSPSSEYVKVLLNSTPFVLFPTTQCVIQRISEGMSLQFRFATGEIQTWHHRSDQAYTAFLVGRVMRRVEDVIIEYRGATIEAVPSIDGLICGQ
ncbi:MAG: hypothetical protein VYA30_12910 [Myxococcota bacterium]|nr:hypothetical protein [Myxococcota bacterium]